MNTQPTSDSRLIENCLRDAEFVELPGYRRNKVRDTYQLPGRRRLLIATDRQSAFDQVLGVVPHKGQVLTQTARYWFDETADICPNHVLSYPDPNVVLAKDLDMLPLEIVVRSYLTGSTNTSLWPSYEKGERVLYGHTFPDGMVKNQRLDRPIITPTTKPLDGGHDEPVTEAEILRDRPVTPAQWEALCSVSLALFARGQQVAAEKGLILVDTKYEFGVDQDGTLVVADEIHTPDSSRFWLAGSYDDRFAAGEEPESLDKEFLRLWVTRRCDPYREPIPDIPAETLIEFSNKYVNLFEQVTGLAFRAPEAGTPVRERIRRALATELPEFF
ncbi:phosphoribosylaminoimidazolesuccinocarboxamide synthase [Streptomyces sp. NPDC021020]|uniref:phosphoribosylaminoimidazolesuccinocarboxamide synthase n=1 Tax=Streptomyces sp. NPDC021020 TaxID=3365109 RepID=UPI0037883424